MIRTKEKENMFGPRESGRARACERCRLRLNQKRKRKWHDKNHRGKITDSLEFCHFTYIKHGLIYFPCWKNAQHSTVYNKEVYNFLHLLDICFLVS